MRLVTDAYKVRCTVVRQALELRLELGLDPEADALELEEEASNLREELLELDVDSVEWASADPPPEGARAVDAVAVGTLVVSAARDVIGPVMRTVRSWMSRSANRSVRVQYGDDVIELTDVSREDQQRALEAFLQHHVENGV